jgi:hypothetical protein
MSLIKLRNIIKSTIEEVYSNLGPFDYRGEHQAPHASDGYASPIYDMTNAFGVDIYTPNAVRYFGTGDPNDHLAVSIIQSLRNKPNATLKIYRSIPKVLTVTEKIAELENHKAYILKYGKLPKGVNNWQNSSQYYDFIYDELKRLKESPKQDEKLNRINDGDWITTVKQYAIDHGKAHLGGNFKLLSKTVKAKNVYGNGDSVMEFGYSA